MYLCIDIVLGNHIAGEAVALDGHQDWDKKQSGGGKKKQEDD